MPTEQNKEPESSNGRIMRLKMILILGPYVVALISLIVSIVLIIRISSVSSDIKETSEALSGVIMQQRDLSLEVMELSDKQSNIEERIEALSKQCIDNGDLITQLHPQVGAQRDPNALPKKVYLTFDDGPSPHTAEILDILGKYGVRATFFTVGKESEAYKDLYRRIVNEGHTLGMHSYSHVYSDIYQSKESFSADLDRISSYLEEVTGRKPKFYRFPGGSNNNVIGNKFNDFASVLSERGIIYFDWNISTGDATNPPLSSEEIVENALSGIDKHEEVIILMHDLGNKDTTVEALSTIIERLQAEGIPIVPIDESTKLIQYNSNTD